MITFFNHAYLICHQSFRYYVQNRGKIHFSLWPFTLASELVPVLSLSIMHTSGSFNRDPFVLQLKSSPWIPTHCFQKIIEKMKARPFCFTAFLTAWAALAPPVSPLRSRLLYKLTMFRSLGLQLFARKQSHACGVNL